ncbi:MAG: hypothetical protein H7308_11745 [Chthonomonadaceae bacterium]|nr:hypothetical protein [Chthonomonadaceae bacterium]
MSTQVTAFTSGSSPTLFSSASSFPVSSFPTSLDSSSQVATVSISKRSVLFPTKRQISNPGSPRFDNALPSLNAFSRLLTIRCDPRNTTHRASRSPTDFLMVNPLFSVFSTLWLR